MIGVNWNHHFFYHDNNCLGIVSCCASSSGVFATAIAVFLQSSSPSKVAFVISGEIQIFDIAFISCLVG